MSRETAYRKALESILQYPERAAAIASRVLEIPEGTGWVGRNFYQAGNKVGYVARDRDGFVAGLCGRQVLARGIADEGGARRVVEVALRRQGFRLVGVDAACATNGK